MDEARTGLNVAAAGTTMPAIAGRRIATTTRRRTRTTTSASAPQLKDEVDALQ